MLEIILFSIIFFSIITIIIIKLFVKIKVKKLQKKIIDLLKKRNNQIYSIFIIWKNDIIKSEEVFSWFIEIYNKELWNEDFWSFDDKIKTNTLIHKEIDFIFKICEKHISIIKNEKYNYIKDSILNKSYDIWEYIKYNKKIKQIYKKVDLISKIFIIWFFIK